MIKQKLVRTRGKLKFSEYFKKLKDGDKVSIVADLGERITFPLKLQGKTGKVVGKRGSSYIVKVKEFNREKKVIIHPVHLKKII
ncbi:MAG: 50S ribosomal protein L21e [Candidatus Pacearchaeota archaeon]